MIECSFSKYIDSRKSLRDRVKVYDDAINAMENNLLAATCDADLMGYTMEDGQMKTKIEFRSISELERNIKSLEAARQRLINRHNSHTTVLRGRIN